MSLSLFHLQKEMLETEISKFKEFLTNNLQEYDIPPADVSLLKEYLENLKSKLSQDLGKSIEDAVKTIVVKEWKTLFIADNYIDEGKSVEEQRYILENLIKELRTIGKVTDTYLPKKISDSINTYFLESEFKVQLLVEELTAELNLCNKEIDWIDALCERIRVMFYSGFLVGDMAGIENLIKKLVRNKNYIPQYQEFIDTSGVDDYYNNNIFDESFSHPLEHLMTKHDYKLIIEEAKKIGVLPSRQVTMLDFIRSLALLCIGVAPSDDYMDIDEDIENNKITGITRAMDQGVSVNAILSTTIVYLMEHISVIETTKKIELWYIQLMSLMYHDTPACLEFCKSASPYMFESIFQRK